MKKRTRLLFHSFIMTITLFALLSWSQPGKPVREFYQLTVYSFSNTGQEKILDNYLQNALLPALHRMGITNVGVFRGMANDTASAKSLYVFVPLKAFDMVVKLPAKLGADKVYQSAGAEYINAAYSEPPYTRIETIILQAFSLAPQMKTPELKTDKRDRVYELRSYESATEKIFKNKVHMFNEGDEVGLFKRLEFNAVFYGEVIAGNKMPNLMYMTSFENMADRDAHWKNFSNDPYWKKLSTMPEYQKNVSHIDIIFLRPVSYSDF